MVSKYFKFLCIEAGAKSEVKCFVSAVLGVYLLLRRLKTVLVVVELR